MAGAATLLVPLIAHPSTPNPRVRALTVQVAAPARDTLRLCFRVEGDIESVRVPSARASAFTDELWKHTCFECFFKAPGAGAYTELNFSPSGEWAAYRFDDYRKGMASLTQMRAPQIVRRLKNDCFEMSVDLPAFQGATQFALSAVLEDRDGNISYWAAAHPEGRPDFHHDRGFILTWPPAGERP